MANLEGILLGIGNPLLDISAEVPADLLTKYDLKPGNAIMADPKHLPLYDELAKNFPVEYIAGGAAQNSMRAAQWMLQVPKAVGYIGCVGNDANGKHLKDAAESYGVTTHYLVDSTTSTGTCAVLVCNKERSLVANLGAAEKYNISHFESAAIQSVVAKAQYFYGSSFFMTHSTPVLISLGKHAAAHNKTFMINLSAPFLIDFFWDNVSSVLPYTDVVFCNEDEAAALGKKLNWGSDLDTIALKLAEFPKENKNKARMVVFTQGAKETVVALNGKVTHYAVPPVPRDQIIDTNGAGDSFVGGFLSQYVQSKPVEQAVAAGHYCAAECIKRSGATLPEKPHFAAN